MKTTVALFALLAVALVGAGCSDRATGASKGQAAPAVPVAATIAEQKKLPVQVVAVGNVQPYTTVGVKSQVAGQIFTVHFSEGQEVTAGQLLFTIDPRPFEAALSQGVATAGQRRAEVLQAEANVVRDQAQLDNARVQDRRYRELVDKELVAREQYDQIRTNAAALEATVRADRAAVENAQASLRAAEAAVENARLQLNYTRILAPIAGRTGNLLAHAGNVVKSNEDSPIVVIAQVRPIYVSFSVPEANLADIKRYRAEGTLRVEAITSGRKQSPVAGTLTFMNNTVDLATGTIQLKATFANTDNALWPGESVDVVLTLTSENAVVLPSQAVQPGQQGPFVWVIRPDLTVESRPVRPGRRVAGDLVIEQGVAAGERVVTDGQLRLAPGAKVDVKPPKTS